MKRIAPFLCLLIVLFLCSCTSLRTAPERITEFSSNIKITCNGKEFCGTLECLSYCSIKFTFSSPERLSGVSVRTDENGFYCDIFGVSDTVLRSELTNNSCVVRLFEAIQASIFDPLPLRKNTAGEAIGNVLNGKYTSVFRADGSIKLIYAQDGFTVEFTEK